MRRYSAPAAVGIALAAVALYAGPLDPPAGPVAPTYKTLSEVEPRTAVNATNTPGDATSLFRITQPGSYYLTGNIAGVSGKNGIGIASSGVTLDLNGFDVFGAAGSLDGIAATASNLVNLAVTNGSLRGWNGDGLDFQTNNAGNVRVMDVQADFNTGVGIKVGNIYIVTRCAGRSNGAGGISCGNQGVISLCQTTFNTGNGLTLGQGASVSDCLSGFNLGTTDAIRAGGLCTITNCTVSSSNAHGIITGSVSTITGCTVNLAQQNGIEAGFGSTIAGCSVNFGQMFNIVVGNGSTVADCTVQFGNLGGIRCPAQCIIRNNTCSNNANGSGTGPNILATGADNRIEGNTCTAAGRGIKVDAAGNFIARNTCSGNSTNWEVVAGNTILVVSAAPAAAVIGNAGGTAPGSTDPNANFTY